MFFKMQKSPKGQLIYIIDQPAQLKTAGLSKEEIIYAEQQLKYDRRILDLNRFETQLYIVFIPAQKENYQTAEFIRKQGAALQDLLYKIKSKEITITNFSATALAAYHLAEGLTLAAYQFLKYRSDSKKLAATLTDIGFEKQSITLKDLKQLQAITEAVLPGTQPCKRAPELSYRRAICKGSNVDRQGRRFPCECTG